MEVDLEGLSREEALEEIERIKKKLQKRKRRSEVRTITSKVIDVKKLWHDLSG